MDFDARIGFAVALAREAGALALRYFLRELDYEAQSKGIAQDWVSIADRNVEALCRTRLADAFPDDAMLGEETGGDIGECTWLIDPIDGTLNFVHGVRYWCVSIAFLHQGVRSIGVIYDPAADELFVALAGRGAYMSAKDRSRARISPEARSPEGSPADGHPMRVSTCGSIDRALLGHGYVRRQDVDAHLRLRRMLLESGAEVKDHGAGALMLAHVAAGRFDAYLEAHMHPWDASAGLLMVEEAGGQVLPYPGERGLRAGGTVLASAPALFDRLAAMTGW
ncbi:MAG TPA: inositol monophosphatase family protein [Casimicrobiaceae bacterium]|nr:inositol monophosphatase family protein [Casimicrobiaceae bacterium]